MEHYFVGLAFYFMMSIVVFAEISPRLHGTHHFLSSNLPDITLPQSLHIRTSVSSIALFITSSLWQFQIHSTLASLRPPSITSKGTYVAPPASNLSFQLFLTPHYTAEILIYLSMTLLARNWTMVTGLIWVVTNLTVSSSETRTWAQRKFKDKQWGKWNVIPFIY